MKTSIVKLYRLKEIFLALPLVEEQKLQEQWLSKLDKRASKTLYKTHLEVRNPAVNCERLISGWVVNSKSSSNDCWSLESHPTENTSKYEHT